MHFGDFEVSGKGVKDNLFRNNVEIFNGESNELKNDIQKLLALNFEIGLKKIVDGITFSILSGNQSDKIRIFFSSPKIR